MGKSGVKKRNRRLSAENKKLKKQLQEQHLVLQESMKHRLKFAYHLKADIIKEGKRSLRQNAADLKVRSEYKAMINAVNWRKQDLTTGAERVFSNDDFMAYKNPYVQFKMNEKDKELEKLKQELILQNQLLKYVKRRICKMGDTYQLKCHTGKLVEHYKQLKALVQ